jgi:iron complex outermembrane receptor protein
MTLAYTADNGYDNLTTLPNSIPANQSGAGGLLNNSNDNNQARLMDYRASWQPNTEDEFDIQFGFNHDVMGVGFWDSTLDKPHNLISYSNTQQLEWLHRADNTSELSLRYYHIQHSASENYQLGSPAYPVSTSMKTGRNEIEFQHILQTSISNRLVYGAGYRQDQVDGNSYYPRATPSYFPTSFTFNEYRVFANDEWRFNQKLVVNAGGMLENDAMGNREFSPRVSLNFHITPQHTLRIGASIAHRTPSLGEQYVNGDNQYQLGYKYEPAPFITTAKLTPEKIMSREIGYLGEFHDIETSLDLRIFNDQMGNMIHPTDAGWQNGMTADYAGVEATIKHSFGGFGNLTFNYTNEIADSNSAALPGQLNSLSDSVPRNIVSLLYSQRLPNDASFSAAYYMQTSMLGFDRSSTDFQPTHRRIDMRIAQPFKDFGGLKGEVSGVVQNLFNTDYTEYIASALNNRRAFVTLTFRWQ